nr:DUF2530 domain-containing protein [Tamaricihabitans halophyticus]
MRPPPPLPAKLTETSRFVIGGTAAWFALCCVLLVLIFGFDTGSTLLLWTATAGWVLGLIGLSIMFWQRSAARRGSRSAQTGQ